MTAAGSDATAAGGSRRTPGRAARTGLRLDSPLEVLSGVGPARSRSLAAAGLSNLEHLLRRLPVRYEDRRRSLRVAEVGAEGTVCLRARIRNLRRVRIRRRGLSLVRGRVEDASGRLEAIWFNRPYLLNQIDEGEEYLLCGQVRRRGESLELVNATVERPRAALLTRGVVPFYPAIEGVGPALLRRLVEEVLDQVDLDHALPEYLPGALLERHALAPLPAAIRHLHRPPDDADVEALNRRRTPAHLRLIYGEFLELQLELGRERAALRRVARDRRCLVDAALRRRLAALLPFELTGAQQRVLDEIIRDLEGARPMRRLLQGDVGSGKTIVAALASVVTVENGRQAAFMAPTELLAEQHHRGLSRLLGGRYPMALLTSSAAGADRARRALAEGSVRLAIGTHALIQEGVEFADLGLAVVDEQHRFGVAQRRFLQGKGARPDLLVMTATPIPRSLALTVYGDLDLSVLDELPPGRTPVATRVEPQARRSRVYAWLRERLAGGSQAYVVLPLIEESDRVAAASIERLGEELRTLLAEFSPAVLHGRTPAEERDAVMREFAAGRVRVLIATTVVEVGVDVPTADVMLIENAERFGLAQLHQLRGRVGRGGGRSVCIALHGRLGSDARRRLEVFRGTTDGFVIAEADLDLRGPGDLLGTRQAGVPLFRVASLAHDRDWLEKARADAAELLAGPRHPELGPLFARVEARLRERGREPFGAGG